MSICKEIIVQNFKIILKINVHFEVRKEVHRKLTIFNRNIMRTLLIAVCHRMEKFIILNHDRRH